MIIWITIQLFQYMFGARIIDDAQALLYTFGFIEMILEVVLLVMLVSLAGYAYIVKKELRKNK